MAKQNLPQTTVSTDNIQNQADQVVGQATALKLSFDQYGIDANTYINTILIPALEAIGAGDSGANTIGMTALGITGDNVSDVIIDLKQQLDDAVISGIVPDGSITLAKLSQELQAQIGFILPNTRDISYLLALADIDARDIGFTNKYWNLTTPSEITSDNLTIDETNSLLTGDVSSETNSITVQDATGFVTGTEVTLQDTSGFENLIINTIVTNTITFKTNLINSYTTANFALCSRSTTEPSEGVRSMVFNGTTSKTTGSVETSTFNMETLFFRFKNTTDITPDGTSKTPISLNNAATFLRWGSIGSSFANETISIRSITNFDSGFGDGTITSGFHNLILRWDSGSARYKAYLDGVEMTYLGAGASGDATKINIDKIALGFYENINGQFTDHENENIIFSATAITEQQAIDITDGTTEVVDVLNVTNSEVIYDKTSYTETSGTISSILNVGSSSVFDQTPTDVTVNEIAAKISYDTEFRRKTLTEDGTLALVEWLKHDKVAANITEAISIVADSVDESYEDADKSIYNDDGSSEELQFFVDKDTTGKNITIRTKIEKTLATDIVTIERELGGLVK